MESSAPIIGLLADPGAPEDLAARIADDVAERISREVDRSWRVEVSEETLPLSPEGTIDLPRHADRLRERHGWDYVVYLSDLPRYIDGDPMISEVTAEARAALVSVPALGAVRVAARTRELVMALVHTAMTGTDRRPEARTVADALGRADVRIRRAHDADALVMVLMGRRAQLRVLSGMVRSNRPGRLLPALTGCIAAAIATGAFGIFYGTMAPVADPLPPWRLTLISGLVTAVLTAWLIIRNHLWNTERGPDQIWRRGMDNASTVITVGLSVIVLYAILLVVMLILAVVVLDASYLRDELLHPIGVPDYLKLGWLAASMGTMAGALGANFDREDAVREATYSRRYHERRKLFDTYEEQEQE